MMKVQVICEDCLTSTRDASLQDDGRWVCSSCLAKTGAGEADLDAIKDEVLSMITIKDVKSVQENIEKVRGLAEAGAKAKDAAMAIETDLHRFVQAQKDVDEALEKAHAAIGELNRAVDDAKKARPIRVEFKKDGKVNAVKGKQHVLLPRLAELLANRMDCYLFGPAGAGKNTACEQLAEAMGLTYRSLQLSPLSLKSELTGFVSPVTTETVHTQFSLAYTEGGVFLADELDNWNPAIVTAVNSALANGRYAFPWGEVERHPDFVFVGAGNTAGLGATAQHSARKSLDGASRDRLVHLAWEIDPKLEGELSTNDEWLDLVQKARAIVKEDGARIIVSPRAVLQGQRLLSIGWSRREVVDAVLLRGDTSYSSKLKNAIDSFVVRGEP